MNPLKLGGSVRGTDLSPSVSSPPASCSQAFNDALLMLNAPHVLLQKHFRSDPNYANYLDAFVFASRSATTGRLLQFKEHPMHREGFEAYNYRTYRVRGDAEISQ